jgi:hypothetical protein
MSAPRGDGVAREDGNGRDPRGAGNVHTDALDKTSDLHMPEGLNIAGQRAYAIIVAYLKQHNRTNTGGCRAFYAPIEWKARGEIYGTASHLVVVYDGGDMRPVFSMDAAYGLDCELFQKTRVRREPYALYEGMQKKLCAAGLYFEECTRWCSAVYSIHQEGHPS